MMTAIPVTTLQTLTERIQRTARPVVLIDGRSGSGKSTLADALTPLLEAELVRLEDLYPGWDGLDRGSQHVRDAVLAAPDPGWRQWDWNQSAPGPWHPLAADRPLVVEGSGALSRDNRALASFAIWVEGPDEAERRARAVARDGDMYSPHWERWAAQEQRFLERENPRALADAVIDSNTWKVVKI